MAIKIITPEEDELPEDLMVEIALLKQCRNKNVVRYYGGYRKGDEIFVRIFFLIFSFHFYVFYIGKGIVV